MYIKQENYLKYLRAKKEIVIVYYFVGFFICYLNKHKISILLVQNGMIFLS